MSSALERWFDRRTPGIAREFTQLQESFDRLFHDFMSLRKHNSMKEFGVSPSCEITEEGNNFVLKFDMPGVKKEEVHVEVDKDRLIISAERREEEKQEDKKSHFSEISYGSFSRTVTLPGPIDEQNIDAKLENGVLTVTLAKTEPGLTKKVDVH